MPIPPDPVLRAATRWLERLPVSGVSRCRALFTTHKDYSDTTPTQYEAAYVWLRVVGLLEDINSRIPAAQRVFAAATATGNTPWFRDADILVCSPAELPEDARRAADTLGIDEAEAYAQIKSIWGKVDTAERERIGAAGELALVQLLTDAVDAHVEHTSLISDGFGYDVSVTGDRCTAHIEVKTTTRRGRLALYLSRNEYETMLRDTHWQLVALRLTATLEIAAIATVPKGWISTQTPVDGNNFGRWESCRLEVPKTALVPGIPSLCKSLMGDIQSPLVAGTQACNLLH
ncbi:protein NO VEIN domain-containing protein [Amycolatopsis sp. CB00013]|uniref:protein NO VEIN domain-containing protein n=1 Tax=Amycolatopsis sp. CB00013 TaxID=1703945 RepID=UPI0009FAA52A